MGALVTCFASTMCECACCMGISCFSGLFNASLSRATRFGHLAVLVTVFVIAIILGQEYPQDINGYNYYTKVDLLGNCNDEYQDSCIYRQLIYRAGFSLFIMFTVLALLSGVSDYVNKSFWIIKFGFGIGLFIALWWVDNGIFSGWAEFARIVSFFWLLIQGLLLLDFSHDLHDILMVSAPEGEEESSMPYIMYITYSATAFAAAIVGLVFLFKDYSDCGLGMFFIILTLLMGVITTIISLLNTVAKGLLTPCIMFAYSVFMCWYALLSSPQEGCNPTADSVSGPQDVAVFVVAGVSMTILMYCVMNGTTILNVFNPEGEGVMMSYTTQSKYNANRAEMASVVTGGAVTTAPGPASPSSAESGTPLLPRYTASHLSTPYHSYTDDTAADGTTTMLYREAGGGQQQSGEAEGTQQESGTPAERVLFHVIMMLVSCYGAMILTNWGKTNGAPEEGSGSNSTTGEESMWLKIVSQWVFLILYLRVLQVAYNNNT